MSHKKSTAHLHYQQIGQGENILLIHGLFGSLENLNMVAKTLAKTYCVTSIDVRNHGNSFHQQGMSYVELAQDVITLLDHLNIGQCHFLGHSMGGKIAMQIALSFPEKVNKLVVADIAPIAYPAHHTKIIEGLNAINLNIVKKRNDADEQLASYVEDKSVRQFLLRNITKDVHGKFIFKCNLANIKQGYPEIMKANNTTEKSTFLGKTLFIKGGNSDYIRPEHQTIITSLFSNAQAKIIQGTGHWVHAEKTIAFNKIVSDFLTN